VSYTSGAWAFMRETTHTHPHLLPSHAKPQIKKRQRHTTHTPVFLSFLSVCAYNSVTMSTSNRVKFLTRSAVCFIKTRSVTSHHSRSRVVWMDTIDRRYARTHTHTSDHSTVSEPNFWIHSTGLLNLSPLQNFRSFEGLFTRLFVFFL